MTAALDLARMRETRADLRAALDRLDAPRRARCVELLAPDLTCRGDAALDLGGAPLPRLRSPNTVPSEPVTLRLPVPTLAALDELAEVLTSRGEGASLAGGVVSRQVAARRALDAGIAALRDGTGSGAGAASGAGAGGEDVTAGAEVLRVLGALDPEAVRSFATMVRAVYTRGPLPAVPVYTGGQEPDPRQPALPLAGSEPDDRRDGPENRRSPPRRGGRRGVDPVERRGPDRLSASDLWTWVRPTGEGVTHKHAAHVLSDLGGGGMAGFACGKGEALAILARLDQGDKRRRCAECFRKSMEGGADAT